MQYVLGFQKLGIDTFWVDHLPRVDPRKRKHVHSLSYLTDRFDDTARAFGFQDQYCIVYDDGERYFGLSQEQLEQLSGEAGLLLSISGKSLPEQSPLRRIPRRAYVDVDPGFTQIWGQQVDMGFDQYNFFFTIGQNVGGPEFQAPTGDLEWQIILPPVVLDLWPAHIDQGYVRFSTVADLWAKQKAKFEGEYYLGKREEFFRFLSLPKDTKQRIALALSIVYPRDYEDLGLLLDNDWTILNPYLYAGDPHSYREFIQFSRAEFSVAKSGYIKTNSGWVSDRTACYLASGKPALLQSTGLESSLPTGRGLLTFRTLDEAIAGVEAINEDYLSHCSAARQLAEEYFNSDIVLGSILDRVGL
jgi:hypothetical protein